MSTQPRPALAQFIGKVFTAEEVAPWVFQHLHELKDSLPSSATIDELAMRLVDLAANRGLIDAGFFEALRQKFPRHAVEISGLADLWKTSAAATNTACIIDREPQWSRLVAACNEKPEHLVFLVHGEREGSVQQFMQRIGRYLDRDCQRRHDIAKVDTGHDQQMVSTAASWERAFMEKTPLADGALNVALADFAEQCAVLFMLDHRQGPLPLERFAARPQGGRREPLRELGTFLSSNLRHALADGGLAHPLRVVIPIEYTKGVDLTPLEPLRQALGRATPLVFGDEVVLSFPDWDDVAPTLRAKMKNVDAATLAACKDAHDKVAARPDRSVRLLGNELHTFITNWKNDRHG